MLSRFFLLLAAIAIGCLLESTGCFCEAFVVADTRSARQFTSVRPPPLSSFTSVLATIQEDAAPLAEETEDEGKTTPPPPDVKCPDCDLCDGSGRIAGGLGAGKTEPSAAPR